MILRIMVVILLAWFAAWVLTGGHPPKLKGPQDYGKISAPHCC